MFRPRLGKWNGMKRNEMEMNEKNNFKIFFSSLVWEFKWERMEWIGENTHSSLFS